MKTLEDAIELALKAHRGQVDKLGEPYILHLLRVMLAVDIYHMRIVAVLHDLLEDTHWTAEALLREGYPPPIVDEVVRLTRLDSESYEDYIQRCSGSPWAREIKMADIDDHIDSNHKGILSDTHRIRYRKAWRYLLECGKNP